ncbi:MAG: hypothetical protein R2909_08485 [Gemmatimonadales bacterium]
MSPKISGFTLVRDAIRLDFPIVPAIRSLLPLVDEMVVNLGRSDDGTEALVRSIDDPKLRILETEWDLNRGASLLREETDRAMAACRHPWGVYIQADEVLHEAGIEPIRRAIAELDRRSEVEGLVVRYRHIFASPEVEAVNRRWYRREVRVVRTDQSSGIHSFRDAQGFRVGARDRRVRARLVDAEIFHYGYLRSARAMRGRVTVDRALYDRAASPAGDPALLRWFPGLRPFRGRHPEVAAAWVAEHAEDPERRVTAPRFELEHLRFYASDLIERITGARLFEYRNYELV